MHQQLQTDYYDKMKQNAAALPVATDQEIKTLKNK